MAAHTKTNPQKLLQVQWNYSVFIGRKTNTRVLKSDLSLQNKQESECAEGSTLKQLGPSGDCKIWR